MSTLKRYYDLTKPGIVYGNDMAAITGFLLASGRHIVAVKFVVTILSVSLIIAAGCVYNNYLDREIDKKMVRTKGRATALGLVTKRVALTYATVLGVLGFALLLIFVNKTTAVIGLIGLVDYVIVYGYSKRKSVYGTLVGSISGATPPLAGFTAVTGHLNTGGLLLFLILVFWQMPHFYAIAMFRFKDYANAKIPVLPVKQGMFMTKIHISVYIVWFMVAASLLFFDGYEGLPYFYIMLAVGLWWLWSALLGFRRGTDDTRWARGVFFKSLIALTVLCVTISVGALL